MNFNTSYVTVQQIWKRSLKTYTNISIHLMLRFNLSKAKILLITTEISIHLMLRFNIFIFCLLKTFCEISIHLMLRFNATCVSGCFSIYVISIHLMLRFNYLIDIMDEFNDIFQYILCCGSTVTANSKNNSDWDFNTSYVAVQLLYFSYIKIISEDFNTSYVAVQRFFAP